MMKKILTVLFLFLVIGYCTAQSKEEIQSSQEKRIKAAYKAKKLTELEYSKLMELQKKIKDEIQVSKADGVVTPKEMKAINKKLNDAEKKLIKYQGNAEIYWYMNCAFVITTCRLDVGLDYLYAYSIVIDSMG